MSNKKCIDCVQKKQCDDSFIAWIFFVIGLVATVAIRVVTVLMSINPLYGKLAWYVGVGGFFIFFVYKFNSNRAIAKIINREKLIDKVNANQPLSAEESNLLAAILCGLKSEKERINYFFIFAVSALALLFAVYFDFIR
jgi:hypothetical protein